MKKQRMMNKNRIFILLLLGCTQLAVWAQETKRLTVLQTSDTHSRIEPFGADTADAHTSMGGFVRRINLIKHFREQTPELLLFDCGDFSQGTPYYNFFRGEVEINLMNEMGYDAVTIGNHEFDFGLDNMAQLFRLANFPIVCANYGVEGTVLEGLVKPYVIIERDGLRIGVFGISPKMEGLVQADKCAGVTYQDPVTVANEVAATLKKKKCDVVICLSHLGVVADQELFIPQTHNIDMVLGGHSHTIMKKPASVLNLDQKSIPLLHTGAKGVLVGHTELTFTKAK